VGLTTIDERVRELIAAGDAATATSLVLRELGAEVLGFLTTALGNPDDADEVFSILSEALWKSLRGFEGRCSVRTWTYVLARHEIGRYRRGVRRHQHGRVPISDLVEVLEAARTKTRSTFGTQRRGRDELSVEDRTLLILRVDRDLAWDDIALAFADGLHAMGDDVRKREAARLRKRFQLIKQRLLVSARAADAIPE